LYFDYVIGKRTARLKQPAQVWVPSQQTP